MRNVYLGVVGVWFVIIGATGISWYRSTPAPVCPCQPCVCDPCECVDPYDPHNIVTKDPLTYDNHLFWVIRRSYDTKKVVLIGNEKATIMTNFDPKFQVLVFDRNMKLIASESEYLPGIVAKYLKESE